MFKNKTIFLCSQYLLLCLTLVAYDWRVTGGYLIVAGELPAEFGASGIVIDQQELWVGGSRQHFTNKDPSV